MWCLSKVSYSRGKPGLKSKIRRPLQQLARRDLAANPSSRRPSRVDARQGAKRYGEAFSQQNKAGRTGEMQRLRLIGCFRRELSKPDGVVSSTNGRDNQMRFVSVALCLTSLAIFVPGSVTAQNTNPVDKPESSTGPTLTPETKGQKQPQGWTGPTTTGEGGAPASSPQGQSPPGMQAAPEGSSKTTTAPDIKK